MPCNLIIAGKNFDISSFLSATRLRVVKKRNKGEPRFPLRPNGEKLPYSFLTIKTSKADFTDLNTQVKDILRYLKRHRDQLLRIKKTKGIDQISLDFGIEFSSGKSSMQIFMPVELVSLAAEFGISIQVSVYAENFGS
ncbi:hypothetical protein ACDQ55_10310 [Chitinophaga sp. 30R24]|uniref:hypothetical protein n=1 Tax=Chitinophaga sp. 30R24 TaxID=3248838 RepID=UPI003B8FBCA3